MNSYETRLKDIKRFYDLLDQLELKVGKKRILANCNGHMDWPERGVYFFFEPGEERSTSGTGMRVVRVGTHALSTGVQANLWNRLKQHQGIQRNGGGNHRGSVFRKHVGKAIIARDGLTTPATKTWGVGNNAPKDVREAEKPIEQLVSEHIRSMPFLWVAIEDEPGPDSHRGLVERHAIALLSNFRNPAQSIDPSSGTWLGHTAASESIRRSGIWNVNHIDKTYNPGFLNLLKSYVDRM